MRLWGDSMSERQTCSSIPSSRRSMKHQAESQSDWLIDFGTRSTTLPARTSTIRRTRVQLNMPSGRRPSPEPTLSIFQTKFTSVIAFPTWIPGTRATSGRSCPGPSRQDRPRSAGEGHTSVRPLARLLLAILSRLGERRSYDCCCVARFASSLRNGPRPSPLWFSALRIGCSLPVTSSMSRLSVRHGG